MMVKMWKLESLLTIGETVKWCSCDEKKITVPQEIKDLAIPLLGIEQQRIENRISNRNFYVPVHGSIIHYC